MDLQTTLPSLLPIAVTWAENQAASVAVRGQALNDKGLEIARHVGVLHPEQIRVAIVDEMPMPENAVLHAAAFQTGLLGPHMAGLTLGYSVLVCLGHDTSRLLSHEFRHVYQYEKAGSIAAFLSTYLRQIVQFGYVNAPLELDAREHEMITI